VLINGLIITYTGDFLVNTTNVGRLSVFIVYWNVLFLFKYLLDMLIDDSAPEVQMQIARQKFIEAKLINKIPDPDLEVFFSDLDASSKNEWTEGDAADLTIYDEDEDHVFLDLPGYDAHTTAREI